MVDLKKLRKAQNMTQAELSKSVGVTEAAISMLESGQRRPSVPVAKKLAAVLGFDWTLFFEEGRADQ